MTTINASSGDTYTYLNSTTFMLSGPASTLNFDSCCGDTAIVTGTNDVVTANEGTSDTGIYDLGTGTQFSFWNIGKHAMTQADLKVYGFQNDLTGQVRILTEAAQYAQTTPDGHGGTLLNISGTIGGQVDFINDPQANLNAHIHAGAEPFPA